MFGCGLDGEAVHENVDESDEPSVEVMFLDLDLSYCWAETTFLDDIR